MAPRKRSRQDLMATWIRDHDCFAIVSDNEIYCSTCSSTLKCAKKTKLTRHLQSTLHTEGGTSTDTFFSDLCEAFIVADIPFKKLDNPTFRKFLARYTQRHIPQQSTLRKVYLPSTYIQTMKKITRNVANNYFWISADETTDILGRKICNVMVGVLNPELPTKPFLIATKVLQHVNAESMAELILNSVDNLFAGDIAKRGNALLFVSDAAAYMIKAGKLLKTSFPRMLHVTCVAHALHRIAEFVKDKFPNVNELISSVKKVFLKAPVRVSLYKQKYPLLPLPPSPVVTRWGTWLEACLFYCKYEKEVASVISDLDDNAESIVKCKTVLKDPSLHTNLEFINIHFGELPTIIKFFEKQNMKLEVGINTLNDTINKLQNITGDFGKLLNKKIDAVFKRNPDLATLRNIANKDLPNNETSKQYNNIIPYLQYAPLTSCDVERSFSKFKNILINKRTNFTEKNIEYVLIINVNKLLI